MTVTFPLPYNPSRGMWVLWALWSLAKPRSVAGTQTFTELEHCPHASTGSAQCKPAAR